EVLPSRTNSILFDESRLKVIASWIDLPEEKRSKYKAYEKVESEVNYEEIPYEFHILYRRQGKTSTKSEWCKHVYNQGPTVTIIKTKTDDGLYIEVFGGYKSISWS